jgi:hypothetical protein
MASSTNALHCSQSCIFHLKFPVPIIFRSSTESSYLITGLSTPLVPSGSWNVSFLQEFCFCILQRYTSHLNIPVLISVSISGSLFKVHDYTLITIYLDHHIPLSLIHPLSFLVFLLQRFGVFFLPLIHSFIFQACSIT